MQKQYTVRYVGAPNLPSGGLEYKFPKIGKMFAGQPKIVFLTDDSFGEVRKLRGLEVKPGPAESIQQVEQRFHKLFEKIADTASETHPIKAIAKISEDEAKATARLRELVVSLAPGNRLWNAQDALAKVEDTAEAKRLEILAGFALEIEKKAAARTETAAARLTAEAQVAPELPAEPKTKPKKRGPT